MNAFVEETPTYRTRNSLKIVLISLLIIGFLLLIITLFKWQWSPDKKIQAGISSTSIMEGEGIRFSDSSEFAEEWLWDFGNGLSVDQNGWHQYEKPGNYTIRLKINNQYTASFYLTVSERETPFQDSISISALSMASPSDLVNFRANGTGDRLCTWNFGDETPETKGPVNMSHVYKVAGNYTVFLYLDNGQSTAHQIRIEDRTDSLAGILAEMRDRDDFKRHLQAIADEEGDFNDHVSHLLNAYLCSRLNAPMKVNGEKTQSFSHYCRELSLDKDVQIQTVKLNRDESLCIISADIISVKVQ